MLPRIRVLVGLLLPFGRAIPVRYRNASADAASSVSSVDEVLTLLHSNRARRHGLAGLSAGEQRRRRAALQAIPLMRALPVVEAQVGLQVALQLRDAHVVRAAEGHPPQLVQDCSLQPFDEAIIRYESGGCTPCMRCACAVMLW